MKLAENRTSPLTKETHYFLDHVDGDRPNNGLSTDRDYSSPNT